jgi:DNA-directed RNA polymerase specialized sigma24 family protein
VLDIPIGTIRSRLARARRALEKDLAERSGASMADGDETR